MQDWLTTIATLAAGSALTLISSAVSDRRTSRREREARLENRRDQHLMKHIEFQRETLLSLQEAAMRLLRAARVGLIHDHQNFQKSGLWQREPIGEEAAENLRAATAHISLLQHRVADDAIRQLADELRDHCVNITRSESYEASENAATEASLDFVTLNEKIGISLRSFNSADALELLPPTSGQTKK